MTASREEESGSGEGEQFASWEKEGLGRLDRAAEWKSACRLESSSDHHGLDQRDDLRRGTKRQRVALRLFRVRVGKYCHGHAPWQYVQSIKVL